jgi:acetylglutamate kinase
LPVRKADKGLTVLKIGGSLLDPARLDPLVRALRAYLRKRKTVIVHGGGREITALAQEMGIKIRFVGGRRFTDGKMMQVVEKVLSDKVNPRLVRRMNALHIAAVGLSGKDGDVFRAKPVKSLGRVGKPDRIDSRSIRKILSGGRVPVFASVASDGKGNALNVNADEMAGAVAVALKAGRLILFTDVPGILDRSGKTISKISARGGQSLIQKGIVTGGMIPKLKSSLAALKKGVREVWILEGKLPLRRARGTLISQNASRAGHPFD